MTPQDPASNKEPGARMRIAVRLGLLILVAYGLHLLLNWTADFAHDSHPDAHLWMLVTVLMVYTILIAIPFVPGVEIGLSLLAMQGAAIAPFIYLATVTGLILAYFLGERLPYVRLKRLLNDLRLSQVSDLLTRIHPLSRAERVALLGSRAPQWLRPFVERYRYVLLAAAVNMPGNAIIGGGGGVLFIAGVSRLFSARAVVLTMALAVLPIPLTVWVFGIDLLN